MLAATVDGIRIVSLYAPNGRVVGSPFYTGKLAWFERLARWIREDADVSGAARPGRRPQRRPDRHGCLGCRRGPRWHARLRARAGRVPGAPRPRADRRVPIPAQRAGTLHLVGLPGRHVPQEHRDAHRPPARVARRWRHAWSGPRSTARRARGRRSRPITRRWSSTSTNPASPSTPTGKEPWQGSRRGPSPSGRRAHIRRSRIAPPWRCRRRRRRAPERAHLKVRERGAQAPTHARAVPRRAANSPVATHDRVSQDPARDVVRRSDSQEAFVRFEDLDLVAAVEATEFDRADRVGLRADPHAAVADHRAFDALRRRLAERPDRRGDRGGRGGRRRTLRCLADFLEWRVVVDRRQVLVDDGRHRFDDDRRGALAAAFGTFGAFAGSSSPCDAGGRPAGTCRTAAAVRARNPNSGPTTDDPSSPVLPPDDPPLPTVPPTTARGDAVVRGSAVDSGSRGVDVRGRGASASVSPWRAWWVRLGRRLRCRLGGRLRCRLGRRLWRGASRGRLGGRLRCRLGRRLRRGCRGRRRVVGRRGRRWRRWRGGDDDPRRIDPGVIAVGPAALLARKT